MADFKINPDGSEQVQYTMEDMPVRATGSSLSAVNGYAAACHWHVDFEMLTVPEGEIDYFVNGRHAHLKQGEGIFVNARRLHYGYSAEEKDCRYRFVVFHPEILNVATSARHALERFTSDSNADFWLFGASSEAMLLFNELYASANAGNALLTLAKCAELTEAVRTHAERNESADSRAEWVVLRKMTGYIQGHFGENITLDQIAAAGAVCRNRCCILFRENLGCTPIEYATRYRLDKACELLRGGNSVTEAALSSGFHGASYFAEVFRRVYGKTPKQYRKDVTGRNDPRETEGAPKK
jgi:AraC-like DNA-binding protein